MSEYGLTSAGFVAPRAADLRTEFATRVIDELDEQGLPTDLDFERDTVFGITQRVTCIMLGNIGELLQGVHDILDPNNATGIHLDSHGAIVGIPRVGATKSRVTLTVTNTTAAAAYLLASEATAEGGGSDGRARWVLLEDTVIPASGSTSAVFEAEEYGATDADPAAIDTIVTPVDGWSTVTNAARPTLGQDRESDDAYRVRRASSLQQVGSRSLNALYADLLGLAARTNNPIPVSAAVVLNNPEPTTEVVGGVTMAPNSIAVIVAPSTLTAAEQLVIAETVYAHLAGGTYTNGSLEFNVLRADGFSEVVRFSFASALAVNVDFVLTLEPTYELADVSTPLETAVAAYFDALDPGDPVRILHMYTVADSIPGIAGAVVTLNAGSVDIEPTLAQLAELGTFNAA